MLLTKFNLYPTFLLIGIILASAIGGRMIPVFLSPENVKERTIPLRDSSPIVYHMESKFDD
ncbi:hypothetical protein A2W14_03835 [Candidatus Gottesmanbacteria bacterium RBG_16_37_8]|uniref:Uncharacterized protein n=1 Tax=Candidatus Gottesmanbacteria bacterium RBG_16_37_8 TaxID=1798371 RepID=A0A1F5YU39_9BACT|nr:MAG: hypothetical protein A2W14_03835 [Candidatus Gottesmanbacteria bacterium RBG_16_37_8]